MNFAHLLFHEPLEIEWNGKTLTLCANCGNGKILYKLLKAKNQTEAVYYSMAMIGSLEKHQN